MTFPINPLQAEDLLNNKKDNYSNAQYDYYLNMEYYEGVDIDKYFPTFKKVLNPVFSILGFIINRLTNMSILKPKALKGPKNIYKTKSIGNQAKIKQNNLTR